MNEVLIARFVWGLTRIKVDFVYECVERDSRTDLVI